MEGIRERRRLTGAVIVEEGIETGAIDEDVAGGDYA